MKFAVIQISNGSFSIASEWSTKNDAFVNFHSVCTTLWNATDVERACVAVVNEKFVIYKMELIKYPDTL